MIFNFCSSKKVEIGDQSSKIKNIQAWHGYWYQLINYDPLVIADLDLFDEKTDSLFFCKCWFPGIESEYTTSVSKNTNTREEILEIFNIIFAIFFEHFFTLNFCFENFF